MVRKIFLTLIVASALLGLLYLSGPHPATPQYQVALPHVPTHDLYGLEGYVNAHETNDQPIKPDNEAQIIWANDSIHDRTPYALVYLHGFTSSHEDGNPVHKDIARKYGMNLYLSRLADHGKSSKDPLLRFTADKAWIDAQEALAIGRELGQKVILMSTSTGSTLSLKLCAEYPEIKAQLLMSPNIALKDSKAWILNNPWGLQIARKILGSDYRTADDTTLLYSKYWNPKIRIEALTQLEELLETTMVPETFARIYQPTLLLYYFKDELHQDNVVRVDAMLRMYDQLGTPEDLKYKAAIPEAGDHGIGNSIKSHDVPGVEAQINKFMQEKLGIKPVKP